MFLNFLDVDNAISLSTSVNLGVHDGLSLHLIFMYIQVDGRILVVLEGNNIKFFF